MFRVDFHKLLLHIVLVWLAIQNGVYGSLRLSHSYGNHMVLQRAPQRAILWGYANVIDDDVIVLMNGVQVAETEVKQDPKKAGRGIWKVKLPAESKAGPFEIKISSSEGSVSLSDVMFGDVWICSGQSNMYFQMSQVNNTKAEIDDSIAYRDVRMLFTQLIKSNTSFDDVQQLRHTWIYPVKGIIDHFSAVCFMYARNLQKHLGYPIGVIASSWGGTRIEVWSSPDAINVCGKTSNANPHQGIPSGNGVLWNTMIHPYLSMTIKGAIWYQGESNAGAYDLYKCQFPAMINDWRQKFNTASGGETDLNFPFGFVQLAPYRNLPDSMALAPERWAQTTDIGYVPNQNMPNTFMATAMDLPDFNSPYGNIHPRFKQDIAERLALGARNVAYGEHSVEFEGPFPTSYHMNTAQQTLQITFDNGTAYLQVNNNKGFDICCAGQACGDYNHWTETFITSHTSSSVSIDLSGCHGNQVQAVRYLWRESPCALKQCALYSSRSHLPVPLFVKTDLTQVPGIIG